MRLACDTGGTFTDLVVEAPSGTRLFKASTTPDDPVRGILDAIALAAEAHGMDVATFLSSATAFIHGTTRSLNAMLTGNTARTAFLTTKGHPDILVFREGGRTNPFDFSVAPPAPYVSRALTFEIPERINAQGDVVAALDEDAVRATIERLKALGVEAVGVCLLWSIANPVHERRIGELLEECWPGVFYTLSHRLNPTLREYRRASATCIDASLKPLMFSYLAALTQRLKEAGFAGRTLMVTSQGGVMDAEAVALAPIHSLNSGPAMAPVAGRHFAGREYGEGLAIVADAGGTTYDVSVVRGGRIPRTRETWIGPRFRGHMTGFSSVDVKSVGAGGGSIAWIDNAGLLRVGPQSASSQPGPAAYGRGGTEPTVTDCAVVLGYIDPDFFLGGAMPLDVGKARAAVVERIASRLACSVEDAAVAALALATEKMVGAISDITVNQGIDPASAVLVAGGGASGLNATAIARRLGCREVLFPAFGAALSAAGALVSDIVSEHAAMHFTTSAAFDFAGVSETLTALRDRCIAFFAGSTPADDLRFEFSAEARYAHQVWEIEVALPTSRIAEAGDLQAVLEAFHAEHRNLFGIDDTTSVVEFIGWRVRAVKPMPAIHQEAAGAPASADAAKPANRRVYFQSTGWVDAPILRFEDVPSSTHVDGPCIVETSFTTIVAEPGTRLQRSAADNLRVSI
jgi:N-methylhydantoinase A